PAARPALRDASRQYDDQVAAQAVDLILNRNARADADGDRHDDGGDPDDHTQHRQERARAVARQRIERQPESSERVHAACSLAIASETTRPSRNVTTRFAYAATSGSCVTRSIVIPCSWFSRRKSCMTSSDVLVSSAPVGSSARISPGS